MELGIIGLPQSGKTTLFNALTRGDVPTDISGGKVEVHTAVIDVPDRRVDQLADIFHPKKIVYAKVIYADIAGLDGSRFAGLRAAFIRAPAIRPCGPLEVLASHQGLPVAVRQGRHLGCSFHPELGSDTRVHAFWLGLG